MVAGWNMLSFCGKGLAWSYNRHCERSAAIQSLRHGPLDFFVGGSSRLKEIEIEVAPARIHPFDQGELFLAGSALDLLFAGDSVAGVGKLLEVNQSGAMVFCCEAGDEVLFVLKDAAVKAVGHASVESAAFAGHDVNPEASMHE